ncbi:YciI family protein [Roseicella frigidaeris]|uniref:YCII-related domain-containing protein n=1 Tax=Roseicella frigidaeris TaxID=2230885 RepID=A0A327M9U1_9PROT|nr:YciI family protein [Roseicella frigidaeris]RAI59257.1 hypothetical protein DOO78_09500 [Roseicella frigidaeris]
MPDYLFLMHDDAPPGATGGDGDWAAYIGRLQAAGRFQGGSAIGTGLCVRRAGAVPPITARLSGFIRVTAEDLEAARRLLAGNPVFEAGGTVEIRELPRTG